MSNAKTTKAVSQDTLTTITTENGMDITFSRLKSRPAVAGRTTKANLTIYIEFGKDGPDKIVRIRHEVRKVDHRDKANVVSQVVWYADQPGVYNAHETTAFQGKDGEQITDDKTRRHVPLSRPIDPTAILAVLNIKDDAASRAFLMEYLPPELGLQFVG